MLYVNPVYFQHGKTLSIKTRQNKICISLRSLGPPVLGCSAFDHNLEVYLWFILKPIIQCWKQSHHWKSLCVRFSLRCPDGISFHWISPHPTLRNCRNRQRNSSIISCTIWPIIRWRFTIIRFSKQFLFHCGLSSLAHAQDIRFSEATKTSILCIVIGVFYNCKK